jgi:hypothetical protein
MAAQAALIEETIVGLKRALRREHECKFFCTPIFPVLTLTLWWFLTFLLCNRHRTRRGHHPAYQSRKQTTSEREICPGRRVGILEPGRILQTGVFSPLSFLSLARSGRSKATSLLTTRIAALENRACRIHSLHFAPKPSTLRFRR